MNKKEIKKFINEVNKDENSKVRIIDNIPGGWATYNDGSSREIFIYEITFDGISIYEERYMIINPPRSEVYQLIGGKIYHEILFDAIQNYFCWSSNKIKELEAKLALARISNDNDKRDTP